MNEPALADQPKLEASIRERLLRVLARLRREISDDAGSPASAEPPCADDLAPAKLLSQSDEQLIFAIRRGLTRLAASPRGAPQTESDSLRGALDGIEFVIRSDLMIGQHQRLPRLLPSFVFLVLLPPLGKPEALRVADRSAQLLER